MFCVIVWTRKKKKKTMQNKMNAIYNKWFSAWYRKYMKKKIKQSAKTGAVKHNTIVRWNIGKSKNHRGIWSRPIETIKKRQKCNELGKTGKLWTSCRSQIEKIYYPEVNVNLPTRKESNAIRQTDDVFTLQWARIPFFSLRSPVIQMERHPLN